jgi:hypothetical protein
LPQAAGRDILGAAFFRILQFDGGIDEKDWVGKLGNVVLSLAVGCGHVQPLDVKLGLWETTMTSDSSGMPPIPPEVLPS